MKKETFFRGIGEVDDGVLERYHAIDTRLARKHAQNRRTLRVLAVAACVAILLCALVPVGMSAHPIGRAVLAGDSEALTEQLNKIEGFAAWQEITAERLEQSLPDGMFELLQTSPLAEILTQTQYPVYAWKSAVFGAYLAQPEMYTYYLDDPKAKLTAQMEIDVTPARYEDENALAKYALTVGDAVYQLTYAYSLGQSLTHQAVHVYEMYGKYGVCVAYVDAESGACVYWENPERAAMDVEGGVSEQSMIEITYDFLLERVRDPEAYTVYTAWEGELFVCEYTRCFHSLYTHGGRADPFGMDVRSCDGVTLKFDRAGNIVCFDAGYLGSLRNADPEIPVGLFDAALDHVADWAGTYSGTGTLMRVVITPDGRIALDNGMCYLLENNTYAATAKYLTYLTEADPDLAEQAYAVEATPNQVRVMLSQTDYYADNKQTSVFEYAYDASGNLICEVQWVDSVEQIRITYVYDKQSRVIEHRTASEIAPSAGGSVQYIYDAQGYLIQKNYFDHRGEPKDQAFFEYDTLGRMIKEESSTLVSRYIYNEDNSGYILWEEGKGTSYTNKTERLFDDAGNCIAVRNYEGDEIASEIVYEYNERNEEIKKSTYVYGVLKQYIVREYRDGKEIRTLVYRSGKLEGVSEFFYNRFGECVGSESVDADGKLIQSFTCEYDYVGS